MPSTAPLKINDQSDEELIAWAIERHAELGEALDEARAIERAAMAMLDQGRHAPLCGDRFELSMALPLASLMSDLRARAAESRDKEELHRDETAPEPPYASLGQPELERLYQQERRLLEATWRLEGFKAARANSSKGEERPFETLSVALKERFFWPLLADVFERLDSGDAPGAEQRLSTLVEHYQVKLGTAHRRTEDLRYLHGVVILSDTNKVDRAAEAIEAHLDQMRLRRDASSLKGVFEHYRAATTLELNGASSLAWKRVYMPLLQRFHEVQASLSSGGVGASRRIVCRHLIQLGEPLGDTLVPQALTWARG